MCIRDRYRDDSSWLRAKLEVEDILGDKSVMESLEISLINKAILEQPPVKQLQDFAQQSLEDSSEVSEFESLIIE